MGVRSSPAAVLSLLCDFGERTFLLGARFPHPDSGGKEELILVCLCPRGPAEVPGGPMVLISQSVLAVVPALFLFK